MSYSPAARARRRSPAFQVEPKKPPKPTRDWNVHLRSVGAQTSGHAIAWFRDREFAMQAEASEEQQQGGGGTSENTTHVHAHSSLGRVRSLGRLRPKAPRIELSAGKKSKSHSYLLLRNSFPAVYALVSLDGAGVLANIVTSGLADGRDDGEMWREMDAHLAQPAPLIMADTGTRSARV